MAKEPADREQFMVRMPPGMRDKIATAATNNGRSMNAEIILRLQESFKRPPSENDALEQMIGALEAQHQRAVSVAEAAKAEVRSVEWSLQDAYEKRQRLATKPSDN